MATLYRCKLSILTVALLLAASLAWAVSWPAEQDMENLTRPPSSSQLDQSVFSNWSIFWSPGLDSPALAYGSPVDLHTRNPQQILAAVTSAASSHAVFEKVRTTDLGKLTRHYFREMRNGLPVLSGRADLVLNARGQLLRWSLRAHDAWLTKGSHSIGIPAAAAALAATRPSADWHADNSLSFAAWFPDYASHSLRAAYWIHIDGANLDEKWEGVVDATTGEIIMDWPGIQTDVLSGVTRGPFWQPYIQSDMQVGPYPFEAVSVNGTTIYTDPAAAFSHEAGNSAQLSTSLEGRWVNVINASGDSGHMSLNVTAPFSPLTWTWPRDSSTDAEFNLYHHVNVVHEWYKVLDPGFDGLDYPVPAAAHYGNHYDNAFWGGGGMAFGDGSAYLNFAMFSDVIYHEYTHGVTGSIYPHGTLPYAGQPGAMNEAWSDYIGCTMNGDPYEAEWIGGTFNSWFRNLLSTEVFPRNWHGEVHADSPFISASLWSIRTALGAPIADSLAHFARYGLAETFLDYLIAVLETDDNDGDLSNGTPHSDVIYASFYAHGIGPGQDPVLAIHDLSYYANGQGGSYGDGDRFIEQGETAELVFSVANDAVLYPPPATNVQITVHTDDSNISIENGTQSVAQLPAGDSYSMVPVLLHINSSAPDHWAVIQVDVTANGGTATLHQVFEFTVGTPHILVIKNDQRTDVERFITAALRNAGRVYDSVAVDSGYSLQESYLPHPGMVIWLSGDEDGTILTPADQTLIQSYLDGGNRVVLSGQNLADDLNGSDFAQNVLQAQIESDSVRVLSATATHSPFVPDEWVLLTGANGAGNQVEETSFIVPDTNRVVFRYGRTPTGPVAGVQFAAGRGLLFGFGIEAISGMAPGSTTLAGFLEQIYTWAGDVMVIDPKPHSAAVATSWDIGPAFPNPFNGATSLSYSIPSPLGADLIIYDLTGRQVESRRLQAGLGTVEWRPQTASGVYFAQIRWDHGQTKPVKLLFLK